jgi:small subunit ribosomal protein S17
MTDNQTASVPASIPAAGAPAQHRNAKVGYVVSRSGNKTIVVEVTRRVQHPFYKRYLNRSKKFYAHDEQNQCRVGDRVRIVESRPLSSLKRWRLDEIVQRSVVLIPEGPAAETAAPGAAPESLEAGS